MKTYLFELCKLFHRSFFRPSLYRAVAFVSVNMSDQNSNEVDNFKLARNKHAKYFMRFLNVLPDSLSAHDTTRLTIAYFSVSGLDILNSLSSISDELRTNIIEWIYLLQVLPKHDGDDLSTCGFQGSTTVNVDLGPDNAHYRCGHLAMTYTGLCTLLALGDDLSRVNRKAIITGLKAHQSPQGNFSATVSGCESDMRFVYCAACISYILDDWSGFDIERATKYVLDSMTAEQWNALSACLFPAKYDRFLQESLVEGYDYGIAQCPGLESHGGTTFCALATLCLSGQLDKLTEQQVEGLKRWLLNRQVDGFQGRPNKPVDTCYSFWVGASLKMLDALDLTNFYQNRKYVYETQDSCVGGFSKWPDIVPDPMHTYLGLGGLSLIGEKGISEIVPHLNITTKAYKHLKTLQEKWRSE